MRRIASGTAGVGSATSAPSAGPLVPRSTPSRALQRERPRRAGCACGRRGTSGSSPDRPRRWAPWGALDGALILALSRSVAGAARTGSVSARVCRRLRQPSPPPGLERPRTTPGSRRQRSQPGVPPGRPGAGLGRSLEVSFRTLPDGARQPPRGSPRRWSGSPHGSRRRLPRGWGRRVKGLLSSGQWGSPVSQDHRGNWEPAAAQRGSEPVHPRFLCLSNKVKIKTKH